MGAVSYRWRGRFTDDSDEISYIAGMLQISEFQLFHVAHYFWFGRDISDKEMEGYFSHYMHESVAPFWVRDLLRKVEERIRNNRLDPGEFRGEGPRSTYEMTMKGWGYVVLLSVMLVLYCLFLIDLASPV